MEASSVTVGTILARLNELAPLNTAEEWDNVGLLIGNAPMPVTRVLTSLDVSPSVIEQAAAFEAQLIVSHHPVIFHPVAQLTAGQPPYELARRGIAAIAMHTNLDKAAGGVNDGLAERLELQNIVTASDGLCRMGTLSQPMEPGVFAKRVGCLLGVPAGGIQWTTGLTPVGTVGVCSGAGGDYLQDLLPRVDAFVTGELHYHEWPAHSGKTIVAAGHFYTEVFAAHTLAKWLAEAFPSLAVTAADEQCPYSAL